VNHLPSELQFGPHKVHPLISLIIRIPTQNNSNLEYCGRLYTFADIISYVHYVETQQ